jgi:hypothetical protein
LAAQAKVREELESRQFLERLQPRGQIAVDRVRQFRCRDAARQPMVGQGGGARALVRKRIEGRPLPPVLEESAVPGEEPGRDAATLPVGPLVRRSERLVQVLRFKPVQSPGVEEMQNGLPVGWHLQRHAQELPLQRRRDSGQLGKCLL